jgi:hypothetical protein
MPIAIINPFILAAPPSIPVTNLALWLKADGLALSNSNPVASFTDFSGLARHFTAAGSARPTYKTNQKGSLPGVDFDGIANTMTGTLDTGVTAYSLFMVLKFKSTAGNPVPFRHGNPGVSSSSYLPILNGGNRSFQHRDSGGATTTLGDAAATTNFELWTMISDATPSSSFRVNGSVQALSPASGVFSAPAANGTLGSFNSGALFASMVLGELILYKAALNSTDRGTVESILLSKWGLP